MTKLYLVRHGQTVDNLNQIMQGQTQGELTDEGIRQALELASQLADTPIDVFVSSDLKRSVVSLPTLGGRKSFRPPCCVSVTGAVLQVDSYLT